MREKLCCLLMGAMLLFFYVDGFLLGASLPPVFWVLLAAALAGWLLELLRHSWSGIGGKLGTTAFVAVIGVVGLATVCGAISPGAHRYAFKAAEPLVLVGIALHSPQITYQLSDRCRLGPVVGSAIPSLVAALVLPASLAGPWLGGPGDRPPGPGFGGDASVRKTLLDHGRSG
jgi:hypothetical protein